MALIVFIALALDRILSEPNRFHPLVGFGYLVALVEKNLNNITNTKLNKRIFGMLGVIILVVPICIMVWLIEELLANNFILTSLFSIIVLYIVIGGRSLELHGQAVYKSLMQGDLAEARQRVGYIVSRETQSLNEEEVAKATIESILENGSDAIFAPLFWFIVAGPIGAVGYRLVNTLDAMWGYRNDRYKYYGWSAARFDDLLNLLPARCCALSYALLGQTYQSLSCWKAQAKYCDSPNAGPVMASGAGALNVKLGGAAIYHGKYHDKPLLGAGVAPVASDIDRAIKLVRNVSFMWVLLIALVEGYKYWQIV